MKSQKADEYVPQPPPAPVSYPIATSAEDDARLDQQLVAAHAQPEPDITMIGQTTSPLTGDVISEQTHRLGGAERATEEG